MAWPVGAAADRFDKPATRRYGDDEQTLEAIAPGRTDMTELATLKPNAAASLRRWHEMAAAVDFRDLRDILHPDAVFRSPMSINGYHSADAVMLAINTVSKVFADFTYHRQAASADGLSVVLEFSARVGDKSLKGIDFLQFGEDGRIVDFEVMVRPLNALQALGQEMGARIGATIPAFKQKG